MYQTQSIYNPTPSDGFYQIRDGIRDEVEKISKTANLLHDKFKPLTGKISSASERAQKNRLYRSLIDLSYRTTNISLFSGNTTVNPSSNKEKSESDNFAFRVCAFVSLSIFGMVMLYELGKTNGEIATADKGETICKELKTKIDACGEKDDNRVTLERLHENAERLFKNISEFTTDHDQKPKLMVIAGIVNGIAWCVLTTPAFAMLGIALGIGGLGWMAYNSSRYSHERSEQKEALEQIMKDCWLIQNYQCKTRQYNSNWEQDFSPSAPKAWE